MIQACAASSFACIDWQAYCCASLRLFAVFIAAGGHHSDFPPGLYWKSIR